MLTEELNNELSKLRKIKKQAEFDIEKAPKGKLRIAQATKHPIYYYRENKKDRLGTYIKASERDMARALAQKGYAEDVLKNINKQINLLDALLRSYENMNLKTHHLQYNQARQALISSYEISDEEYAQKWYEETSAKIAYFKELKQLEGENTSEIKTFTTANGEIVKSKSEVIIADTLLRLGIPYQYELPFEQNGRVVFRPDFTVLNIKRRKQVYIEHFGRMGEEEYRKSFFWKMSNFSNMGILQGKNLLMTFEDYDNSFDIADYIKDIEFMCMS